MDIETQILVCMSMAQPTAPRDGELGFLVAPSGIVTSFQVRAARELERSAIERKLRS